MMEEPTHKFEGRGQTMACDSCGRRFQVVGKVPKHISHPPCPHCGHSVSEDDEEDEDE